MIKKISTEEIYKNPYFTYFKDEFELEDGKKGQYFYCVTLGGAMIIPVLEDGRLALVRQHRYLADKHSIEFPCGGVDGDESAHQTAGRELLDRVVNILGDVAKIDKMVSQEGRRMSIILSPR